MSNMNDMVKHPNHYQGADGLEVFEVNVIKYVLRFSQKNGVEDLKKARVYLEKLIETMEVHHEDNT